MRRMPLRSRPRPTAPAPDREQRLAERAARVMAEATPRAAAIAHVGAPATPVHKTEPQRDTHLRAMARGKPCLLQVPGVCCRDSATVVCCHSNLSIHGKAGARKADDQYSVWGCMTCHVWLDQGPAPRARKEAVFMGAHLKQVLAWRAIATDPGAEPRDQAAAQWALRRLNASPNLPPAQEP